MPRLNERLEQIRNVIIWDLYQGQETAEDIGLIFGLTTSQVYNIIKTMKEKKGKNTWKNY